MLTHPRVREMISMAQTWPGYPLKRHNDAKHPLQTLTVLADFGVKKIDDGMADVVQKVTAQQSPEGPFETQLELYKRFGGLEGEHWVWMGCDAPVLLYVLSAFGMGTDSSVVRARDHLLSMATDNGWHCSASPVLGKFRGPGKKDDPCPIANLQALKALSLDRAVFSDQRIINGLEMILKHWEIQGEKKYFLFGIGTDFKKLKYPYVWYDLLHVTEVLSRFDNVVSDPRFQADGKGINGSGG